MYFHFAQHPLILGFSWLKKHNPYVDWELGKVKQWDPACQVSCLDAHVPSFRVLDGQGTSASMPGLSDYPDLSKVPACYHDLKEVLRKSKATSLPTHRGSDYPMDLVPGIPIPTAWLYSFSSLERRPMEEGC